MTPADWIEYDRLAEHCAAAGLAGAPGDLPPTSGAVLAEIEENPEEFRERVRLTAYAKSFLISHSS